LFLDEQPILAYIRLVLFLSQTLVIQGRHVILLRRGELAMRREGLGATAWNAICTMQGWYSESAGLRNESSQLMLASERRADLSCGVNEVMESSLDRTRVRGWTMESWDNDCSRRLVDAELATSQFCRNYRTQLQSRANTMSLCGLISFSQLPSNTDGSLCLSTSVRPCLCASTCLCLQVTSTVHLTDISLLTVCLCLYVCVCSFDLTPLDVDPEITQSGTKTQFYKSPSVIRSSLSPHYLQSTVCAKMIV